MLDDPQYTPNRLMNYVYDRLGAKNQTGLCSMLGVPDSIISKVINRKQPMSAQLMIAILDSIPEMTIAQVRELAGIKK